MASKQIVVMHIQTPCTEQTQAFHSYCDICNLLKWNKDNNPASGIWQVS